MNRTTERTLDILELFCNNDTLSLASIAKLLGIPKSSAFDIVKTLESRSFLEIENDSLKTYRLGYKSFRLGNLYRNNLNIYHLCRPALLNIKNSLNKTVFLGVMNDKHILNIDMQKPYGRMFNEGVIGEMQSIHSTSMGKAILSAFTDDEIFGILGPGPYKRHTKHTLTTYEALIENIQLVRKRGYALDNSENYEHISCVGMPILDHTGYPVAAISVSDFIDSSTEAATERAVEMLSSVIGELCLRLGYTGKRTFKFVNTCF